MGQHGRTALHAAAEGGHTDFAPRTTLESDLLDFLKLVIDGEAKFQLNLEDDIVAACLMCRDGQVVRTNA